MMTRFSTKEISACTTQEQLTALLNQAASREVLYRTFREYGLTYAGLQFCMKEKLARYLACELLILMKEKPLRRKVKYAEDIALSFTSAVLAGMMIFMLVL